MRARLESPRANYATPAVPSGTTRAFRQRQLPTNHGHAALDSGRGIRVYQSDSSSKTPHPPLRVVALRNPLHTSFNTHGSDPPKISLDGWSFHSRLAVRGESRVDDQRLAYAI